ncbi:hypothetical protein GGF43_002238 [Coemansia sp. RSA 2618]|nr:hypothetical protein GGF43_002238 [Coemansia sp. RSA 2618]
MLTSSLLRGGKWSVAAFAFLTIAVVQTALNIALEATLIHKLQTHSELAQAHIIYDGGFISAQIAALALAFMALYVRSEPLATAATALDILLVVLQAAQLAQTGALHTEALQAVVICALVLGSAAKAWLTWRQLKKEFGWQVYRALGADLRMRRMFFCQQLLLALVIVAAFLLLQLWLQLAAGAWMCVVAAVAASAFVLSLCLFAAVQELLWLMRGCVAVFVATAAFFIYKLVDINRRLPSGNTSRQYTTLFLVMLLILDVALIVVSLVVAHAFGRGLRERLRRFQILARGDVDLDAIPRDDPCAAKPGAAGQAFSEMLISTVRSLKESPDTFRAFFSGLDVPDNVDLDRTMSVCSLSLEPGKIQPSVPTLASPQQIYNGTTSPEQSIPDIPSASERSSHISRLQVLPTPRISALVLSIGELNMINGEGFSIINDDPELPIEELNMVNGELVVCRTHTREFSGVASSPAASWSLVSSISFRDSTSTAGIKSPTRSIPPAEKVRAVPGFTYANSRAPFATLQGPKPLRFVKHGRRFCRSEDGTSVAHISALRSALSVATSVDDSSVEFGSRSRATMLNEGFDA